MTDVQISPLASADMREIADYIRREKHNRTVALRLLRRFQEEIDSLRSFPESGAPLLAAGNGRCPYRYLICGNYLIFYHVDASAVRIDRVLYGRRDYLALLFGDSLNGDAE